MPRSRSLLLLFSILYFLSSILSAPSHAALTTTKYYIGPDNGLWSDPNNWSLTPDGPGGAGPPVAATSISDNAILTTNSGKTVFFDSDYSTTQRLNQVNISGTGNNVTFTLTQSAGTLNATSEIIGPGGIRSISGGADLSPGISFEGTDSHSAGLFVSGTAEFHPFNEDFHNVNIFQTGGHIGALNSMAISGNTALFLSAGSFTADSMDISGPVIINQTGGEFAAGSDYLRIHGNPSGLNYYLRAGTLLADDLEIGYDNVAILNQSGGSVTVQPQGIGFVLGNQSTGRGIYNLSSGSLSIGNNAQIGGSGVGVFNQSGGTTTVNFGIVVAPSSSLTLTGGSISGQNLNVDGVGTQSGGAIHVRQVGFNVGTTASYTLSSTGLIDAWIESIAGTLVQNGGANSITTSFDGGLTIAAGGTYDLNQGSLSTLILTQNGNLQIKPTASTTLASFTQSPTANLDLELDGPSPSQYASLAPTSSSALNGLLTIDLPNTYSPQLGDSFLLINSPSLTGTFSSYNLPSLSSGLQWQPTYTPTSFSLTVVIPEPSLALLLPALLLLRHRRPAA